MLMDAQQGQQGEPDRDQQDEWREAKTKRKNKIKNPETLPSKKPCIIPPGLPKNPLSEENKWSNALSGTSRIDPAALVDNNPVHEPPTATTEWLFVNKTGFDNISKYSTSKPPTEAQMTRREQWKIANEGQGLTMSASKCDKIDRLAATMCEDHISSDCIALTGLPMA